LCFRTNRQTSYLSEVCICKGHKDADLRLFGARFMYRMAVDREVMCLRSVKALLSPRCHVITAPLPPRSVRGCSSRVVAQPSERSIEEDFSRRVSCGWWDVDTFWRDVYYGRSFGDGRLSGEGQYAPIVARRHVDCVTETTVYWQSPGSIVISGWLGAVPRWPNPLTALFAKNKKLTCYSRKMYKLCSISISSCCNWCCLITSVKA